MKLDKQERMWPDSDQFHIELPEPVTKEYDEFGHHKSEANYCTYTLEELKQGRFKYERNKSK